MPSYGRTTKRVVPFMNACHKHALLTKVGYLSITKPFLKKKKVPGHNKRQKMHLSHPMWRENESSLFWLWHFTFCLRFSRCITRFTKTERHISLRLCCCCCLRHALADVVGHLFSLKQISLFGLVKTSRSISNLIAFGRVWLRIEIGFKTAGAIHFVPLALLAASFDTANNNINAKCYGLILIPRHFP